MNQSTTADWLEDNGESATGGTASNGLETSQSINDKNDQSGKDFSTSSSCFSCYCGLISLTSLILLALFVYSASVQSNDIDGIHWIIYYSYSACIPAAFLVYYIYLFPTKVVYVLSAANAIWSIVFIVISALKLKDIPKGGATNDTGDNPNQTLRQEIAFELGGVSIGLFSSLYHICMAKFLVKKNNKDE
mmetsp:Transcript_9333/g.10765  ORF Transcript_9333/g.10765 Transcript_9333/m.10765 type:complete len:190 (-) Transcript_9333:60-629(-)